MGEGAYLFIYENDQIDIDFGPGGRNAAFEPYRLRKFLQFRMHNFKYLENELEFDRQFNQLVSYGIIMKHPNDSDDNLYYFRESLEDVT